MEKDRTKEQFLSNFLLQGCLLEGQEARPGEQHVGAAAGVFGSVGHTKVIRARAFRRESVRRTTWGMPRLNSKPWYGTETLSATTDYQCRSTIISHEVSETASRPFPLCALAVHTRCFAFYLGKKKKAAGASATADKLQIGLFFLSKEVKRLSSWRKTGECASGTERKDSSSIPLVSPNEKGIKHSCSRGLPDDESHLR